MLSPCTNVNSVELLEMKKHVVYERMMIAQ